MSKTRRSRFDADSLTREGAGPRATSTRRRRAVESLKSAAETIGPIVPGLAVFCLTRGQFGMLDMVRHIATEIGPCSVSVWTWVVSDYEVETMGGLLADGTFTAGRLVVDRGAAQVRTAAVLDAWRERFGPGSVRMCMNHAKIARVWNADRRVLLRGSMNFNFNPRFEQADITEGGEDFEVVAAVEDALPDLPLTASRAEIDNATGIGKAWEAKDLAMFRGVRPWKL